jgi:transposase
MVMKVHDHCIYCRHSLYRLNDGMVKCSACKKKYSPKKAEQTLRLIHLFCDEENALSASKTAEVTYSTALTYYQHFRKLITEYCEDEYHGRRNAQSEYEEYIYQEKSKRNEKSAIFDAHNFLTFAYGDSVYNILMPSLNRYKQQFIKDNLEEVYEKEFSHFMRSSKIIRITAHDNTITRFWRYFENFITPFKGVSREYFPYYLKEAEFTFNTPIKERSNILTRLYFRSEP